MSSEQYDLESIFANLTSHVKGQDEALKNLSVLHSMHMFWFRRRMLDHPSPNGLMIGPTGVGKTYTIQRAAEILQIPYVVVDTTALVPAGIVGLQIEDVAEELVESAKALLSGRRIQASSRATGARLEGESGALRPVGEPVPSSTLVDDLRKSLGLATAQPTLRLSRDSEERLTRDAVALAEKGIVFFDEFDKIAIPDAKDRSSRDMAAQVQRRLLKFIEGAAVRVGVKQHGHNSTDYFLDTSGILCIGSGAFADIGDARRRRAHELARFRATAAGDVIAQDLIEYGFMPELIARLPVLMQYGALDVGALKEILLDAEQGPLRVWQQYYADLELTLDVSAEVGEIVAQYAFALKLGARGLSQILFPILADSTTIAKLTGATHVILRADQFLAHPSM